MRRQFYVFVGSPGSWLLNKFADCVSGQISRGVYVGDLGCRFCQRSSKLLSRFVICSVAACHRALCFK